MKSQEELKENIVALINLWFNDYNDDSDDVLSNNIIDLFDLQNAKLVEENERYKDFHDNWFNVATDYLKLKEENKELIQTNNDFHSRINHDREFKEVLKSELTQAKERIEGLEEKQIGFAEWLMEKGYLPLLRKITKEKVRFRIDELYAIYSQTLLNG